MTAHNGKFLPVPRPEIEDWWENCRNHKLTIQRCSECGEFQFYPRIICAGCMSGQLEWVESAGRGTVSTYTVCRLPVAEAYAGDVPYVVALIRLEEGPVMMGNVVDCDPESVKTGIPVEVTFQKWSETVTIPQFKPVPERKTQ